MIFVAFILLVVKNKIKLSEKMLTFRKIVDILPAAYLLSQRLLSFETIVRAICLPRARLNYRLPWNIHLGIRRRAAD